jgi:hypothetical protein
MSRNVYNPNFYKTLKNFGVTNHDTPDIGELQHTPRFLDRAYCTSIECGGNRNGTRKVLKVSAKPTDRVCKDCGYALFWKSKKELIK